MVVKKKPAKKQTPAQERSKKYREINTQALDAGYTAEKKARSKAVKKTMAEKMSPGSKFTKGEYADFYRKIDDVDYKTRQKKIREAAAKKAKPKKKPAHKPKRTQPKGKKGKHV